MLLRCRATVFSLRYSSAAIALVGQPGRDQPQDFDFPGGQRGFAEPVGAERPAPRRSGWHRAPRTWLAQPGIPPLPTHRSSSTRCARAISARHCASSKGTSRSRQSALARRASLSAPCASPSSSRTAAFAWLAEALSIGIRLSELIAEKLVRGRPGCVDAARGELDRDQRREHPPPGSRIGSLYGAVGSEPARPHSCPRASERRARPGCGSNPVSPARRYDASAASNSPRSRSISPFW